jgi:hypothetical protein
MRERTDHANRASKLRIGPLSILEARMDRWIVTRIDYATREAGGAFQR